MARGLQAPCRASSGDKKEWEDSDRDCELPDERHGGREHGQERDEQGVGDGLVLETAELKYVQDVNDNRRASRHGDRHGSGCEDGCLLCGLEGCYHAYNAQDHKQQRRNREHDTCRSSQPQAVHKRGLSKRFSSDFASDCQCIKGSRKDPRPANDGLDVLVAAVFAKGGADNRADQRRKVEHHRKSNRLQQADADGLGRRDAISRKCHGRYVHASSFPKGVAKCELNYSRRLKSMHVKMELSEAKMILVNRNGF